MTDMMVSEFAAAAGVNRETIRYYETRGLLPRPVKGRSGYRLYDESDLKQIRFIIRAKELGFTLKEISELLDLRAESSATCADVQAEATAKIDQIERKIAALKAMKKSLKQLASQCAGQGPATKCSIINALEGLPCGSA